MSHPATSGVDGTDEVKDEARGGDQGLRIHEIMDSLQSSHQARQDPELQSKLLELKEALGEIDRPRTDKSIDADDARLDLKANDGRSAESRDRSRRAPSRTGTAPLLTSIGLHSSMGSSGELELLPGLLDLGASLAAPDGDAKASISMRYDAGPPHGEGHYVGQVKGGVPHGHGSHIWTDRRTFDGQWRDGKPHGIGKWTSPHGESYEGELVHGKKSGKGIFTYRDGRTYTGDWMYGMRQGHGTRHYPDGSVYVGEWARDKRQGRGEYRWKDGRVWAGEWREGNPVKSSGDASASEPANSEPAHSERALSERASSESHKGSDRDRYGKPIVAADKSPLNQLYQHQRAVQSQYKQHRRNSSGRTAEGYPPTAPEPRIQAGGTVDRLKKPIVSTEGESEDVVERQGTSSTQAGTMTGSEWGGVSEQGFEVGSGIFSRREDSLNTLSQATQAQREERQQQRHDQEPDGREKQLEQQQRQPMRPRGLFGGAAEKMSQWGATRVLTSVAKRRTSDTASSSSHDAIAPRSRGEQDGEGAEEVMVENTDKTSRGDSESGNKDFEKVHGRTADVTQSTISSESRSPSPIRTIRRDDTTSASPNEEVHQIAGAIRYTSGESKAQVWDRACQTMAKGSAAVGKKRGDVGIADTATESAPFDGSGSRSLPRNHPQDVHGDDATQLRSLRVHAAQGAKGDEKRRRRDAEVAGDDAYDINHDRHDGSSNFVSLAPPAPTTRVPANANIDAENGGRYPRDIAENPRDSQLRPASRHGSRASHRGDRSRRRKSRSRSRSRGPDREIRVRDTPSGFDLHDLLANEHARAERRQCQGERTRGESGRQKVNRSRSLNSQHTGYDARTGTGGSDDEEVELSDFDDGHTPARFRSKRASMPSQSRHRRRRSDDIALGEGVHRSAGGRVPQDEHQSERESDSHAVVQEAPVVRAPSSKTGEKSGATRQLRASSRKDGVERRRSRDRSRERTAETVNEHMRGPGRPRRSVPVRESNLPDYTVRTLEMSYDTGMPHGAGEYVGQVKEGVPDGQGTIIWEHGKRYTGEWKQGKRTGHGTFSWEGGRVHQGQWLNNKAHGQGTFWYGDGTSYVGGWEDGLKHGHGVRTYLGGAEYEGDWRFGMRHGKAVWRGQDSMYEGQYANDFKNGLGTYIWSDGRKYVGAWQDGKQHGQGILYGKDGRVIQKGKWRRGDKTIFF